MKKISASLLTFCLSATSLNLQAETENTSWYQVEVILFAQSEGNYHLSESWHDKPTVRWHENMVLLKPYIAEKPARSPAAPEMQLTAENQYQPSPLQPAEESPPSGIEPAETDYRSFPQQADTHPVVEPESTDLAREPFVLLPPDRLQLTGFASRIKNASSLRLLAHVAWRQPINHGEQAQPVLIQAGDRYGLEFEVEGTLSVRQNRYLHFATQLFFSQFSSAVIDGSIDWSIFSEPLDVNIWSSSRDAHLFNTGREKTYSRTLSVMLDSSERITKNSISYFDHPLFGLAIKVIPFDPVMEMEPFKLDDLPERRVNLTQGVPASPLP